MIPDFDLAVVLDDAFGPRPAVCHDCHAGRHTQTAGHGYCLCRFCLCVERLTVPAEIAAELQMAGVSS